MKIGDYKLVEDATRSALLQALYPDVVMILDNTLEEAKRLLNIFNETFPNMSVTFSTSVENDAVIVIAHVIGPRNVQLNIEIKEKNGN